MVGPDTLSTMVHEVQVRTAPFCVALFQTSDTSTFSYIVGAAMDGGTQVILFILNFVSTTLSLRVGVL